MGAMELHGMSMRWGFGSLVVFSALMAGCGGSGNDFVVTGSSGTSFQTTIPAAGGMVEIPGQGDFRGRIEFDPGSPANNRITMATSIAAPSGVSLPFVGLDSPRATTRSFFHLSFTVSQPIPVELIESVRIDGPVQNAHEYHHADLFELSTGTASALGQSGSTQFLQEFPGESDATGATFDELDDTAILQPGRTYVMRFKSTDQQTLTLKVVNDSGLGPCYIFITGRNPNLQVNDPRFYRVTREAKFVAMDVDDLQNGTADYNIPVPNEGLSLQLPMMSAGRVYVSLGDKIKSQLNPPRIPSDPPAFWVAPSGWSNPNEPNYKTLWDWVEFDYKLSPDTSMPGMGINKTEVQMVSLPFTISMKSKDSTVQTVGAKEGARSAIFSAIEADNEFKNLIVAGPANGVEVDEIRVVSPDNGIYNVKHSIPNTPTFPLNYYDSYIDQVWDKYKAEDLTMITSAFGTYVARVNDQEQLVFTQTGKRSVVVPKPTSSDAIIGDGALLHDVPNAAPGEEEAVVREIASTMSANFNRSTLLVQSTMRRSYAQGLIDPSVFYQTFPTNLYSKVIHANSLPTEKAPYGAAYGFGYDDNLDQSSFIGDNRDPAEVTIKVTKF